MILLASQKDLDKEEPTAEDLYAVGTAAVIMRMLKLPDGRIRFSSRDSRALTSKRSMRRVSTCARE